MPADKATTADADIKISAKRFVEYTSPTSTCDYDMSAVGAEETKDPHGRKMWKFGSRVSLHIGRYQKPDKQDIPMTVRLEKPSAGGPSEGGVIRFKISVEGAAEGDYYPIGMSFTRADETEPVGVRYTTGKVNPQTLHDPKDRYVPIGDVKINEDENIIELRIVRVIGVHSRQHKDSAGENRPEGVNGTHRTYRFMIFIQEARTGKIGVIADEIENPNEP